MARDDAEPLVQDDVAAAHALTAAIRVIAADYDGNAQAKVTVTVKIRVMIRFYCSFYPDPSRMPSRMKLFSLYFNPNPNPDLGPNAAILFYVTTLHATAPVATVEQGLSVPILLPLPLPILLPLPLPLPPSPCQAYH